MKEEILKIVSNIKGNLKSIDKDGVSHPLLDDIYDSLALIEDTIYDDDMMGDGINLEEEDY
jgi:phosphotransferase system IIA component